MSLIDLQFMDGRYGNNFIQNMAYHLLCEKYKNFKIKYKNEYKYKKIIQFCHDYNEEEILTSFKVEEKDFMLFIKNNKIPNTTFSYGGDQIFFQTKEFATYLHNYFREQDKMSKVISNNPYKERYQNNNDVFVHIRLDDTIQWNPGFVYYDAILSSLNFNKGFISSDTITHPICQDLIQKYNLAVINENEENTILFASTCNYIVLSLGTFSWMMSLLAFYSEKLFFLDQPHKWAVSEIFMHPNGIKINPDLILPIQQYFS